MFLKFSLLFTLLLFLSLLISVFVLKKKRKDSYLYFFETGEFSIIAGFFIGVFVGEEGFLTSYKVIYPVILFLVSYVGFLMGTTFKVKEIFESYKSEVAASFFNTVLIVLFGIIVVKKIVSFSHFSEKEIFLLFALILPFNYLSSYLLNYETSKRYRLIVLSSIVSFLLILIFGVFYSSSYKIEAFSHSFHPVFGGALFSLLIGFSLYSAFLYKLDGAELLSVSIGIILFSSGVSASLRIPSVFVAFLSGFIFSNLPKRVELSKFSSPYLLEKPVYVLLLIYLGYFWGTRSEKFSYRAVLFVFLFLFLFLVVKLIFYSLLRLENENFRFRDFMPVSSLSFVFLVSCINEKLLTNTEILLYYLYGILIIEAVNSYIFLRRKRVGI